jgi:uncharacterized membrane protein YvbJ
MDFCNSCGERLNRSSRTCTNCGSRMELASESFTPVPRTRLEKRKSTEIRNKRFVVVAGSIIGLLLVLCSAFLIIKNLNNHISKTDVAATKMTDQSKSNIKATDSKNSAEKNDGERSNLTSSEYILPNSDKTVLGEEDIATLSKEQLRLARNEIYARHGYVFNSSDLQKYFSSKSWYQPNTSYNGSLSDVEKENVKLLKASEAHM